MKPTFDQIRVLIPDEPYSILVGPGMLRRVELASYWRSSGLDASPMCAVITNATVAKLYADSLVTCLHAIAVEPHLIEIPEGEAFKTLDTVRGIYDCLVDGGLDRNSPVVALGGGVIGDLAGFVAATYVRGVPFVQVPTTLLAMVDASIGGKVAVDHPRGKNLIGAFKQPRLVIADTHTLSTLPHAEWRAGLAEVVKHGIIGDAGLLTILEDRTWESNVERWIPRAMQVKVDIVARDPHERGERAKLNLGHTFAHALETESGFALRHGDAVAIGLVCATRLATRLRVCDARFALRVERLLQQLEMPTRIPRGVSIEGIVRSMQTDKKRVGSRLQFVLPRGPGDVFVSFDVEPQDVLETLSEVTLT